MPDSSIDRSVTLPPVPEFETFGLSEYLRNLNDHIAAAYDNLAERINEFLVFQDWQDRTYEVLSAGQDNYSLNSGVVHRFSTSGAQTVTGFVAPQVPQFMIVLNTGPDALTIAHQSASSDGDNRVVTTTGLDLVLTTTENAGFWYDTTVLKWRQLF